MLLQIFTYLLYSLIIRIEIIQLEFLLIALAQFF